MNNEKELRVLKSKYRAALLQLQQYSDNRFIIQGSLTLDIEQELKYLNL